PYRTTAANTSGMPSGAPGPDSVVYGAHLSRSLHPTRTSMRLLILVLALGLPMALTACQDTATDEAIEEGAPPGDREDVIGDGEIIDEPGEPEGNLVTGADTHGDGFLSADEFAAAWADRDLTLYDTDGDGLVSQAEFDAYNAAHPDM